MYENVRVRYNGILNIKTGEEEMPYQNIDKGKQLDCFAYLKRTKSCSILRTNISAEICGKCRFRKPERDVTNGKTYPYPYKKIDLGSGLCDS